MVPGVRRRLLLVALAMLASGFVTPAAVSAEFARDTCAELSEAARGFSGRVGYVVTDLATGASCASDADAAFNSASLYKLLVLVEAHRQRAAGVFAFDETLEIVPEYEADDPEVLRGARPTSLPAFEALRLMVQVSDNPSAAALRDRLGHTSVAGVPGRLGLRHTRLGEQFTTTAGDMAQLFRMLHEGRVVNASASREMLQLLGGEYFHGGLAAGLPADALFAHKTGDSGPYAHDVGIVSTARGAYAVAVLTETATQGELIEAAYAGDGSMAVLVHPSWLVYDLAPSYLLMRALAAASYAAYVPNDPGAGSTAGTAPPRVRPNIVIGEPSAAWWQQGYNAWLLVLLAGLAALPLVALRRPRPAATIEAPAPRPYSVVTEWLGGATSASSMAVFASAGAGGGRGTQRPRVYTARQRTQFDTFVPVRRDETTMRFGSRNQPEDDRRVAAPERVEPVEERIDRRPAPPVARVTAPPATSARLRRVAEYFVAQEELLQEMRRQVEVETAPLADLLIRQQSTMAQAMANMDDRLRPLNEYADAEEENLAELEQRMSAAGMDFVARSFSEYLAMQRERIAETRGHIAEQRAPFARYDEDARSTVEIALSRFDDDLAALEQNLTEQRRVMLRMLDAMRSESFAAVKDFLANRESLMNDLTRSGVSDPGEIAARLHGLRSEIAGESGPHVAQVLSATDAADQRLSVVAPARPRAVAPARPTTAVAAPTAEAASEVAEDDDEAGRTA